MNWIGDVLPQSRQVRKTEIEDFGSIRLGKLQHSLRISHGMLLCNAGRCPEIRVEPRRPPRPGLAGNFGTGIVRENLTACYNQSQLTTRWEFRRAHFSKEIDCFYGWDKAALLFVTRMARHSCSQISGF